MTIKVFFSQNDISEAWGNFLKNINSQTNLSEAWEHFKNNKAHHAQKDISEALEQFHSSRKNLSEAYKAILTNHGIILAFSNRCVQQG